MIIVTFYKNLEGKFIGFDVKGHSGYAEAGYDIICASISTIAQATAHGIEIAIGEQVVKTESPDIPLLSVEVPDAFIDFIQVKTLFQVMNDVVESVQEQFEKYVYVGYTYIGRRIMINANN